MRALNYQRRLERAAVVAGAAAGPAAPAAVAVAAAVDEDLPAVIMPADDSDDTMLGSGGSTSDCSE